MNLERGGASSEIRAIFKGMGEGLRYNRKRKGIELAFRYMAADRGVPVESDDRRKKAYLGNEALAFTQQPARELTEAARNYTIPDFDKIIGRQGDKILYHEDNMGEYRKAAAFIESAKNDARDFRSRGKMTAEVDPELLRVAFQTEDDDESNRYSYGIKQLLLAYLSRADDGDNEWSLVPYPHLSDEGKLNSISLLIFTPEQIAKLKEIYERPELIKKIIPKEMK